MPVCDSYPESNYIDSTTFYFGAAGASQSFTGDGNVLDRAIFYVKKAGSPATNMVAKIYAHTGTFGTSSLPTGSALATSGTVAASSLSTSFGLVTFTFTGGNKITLTNGTNYVVTLEVPTGDFSNNVAVGRDSTSSTHPGNAATYNGSSWSAGATLDMIFYVHTDAAAGGNPAYYYQMMRNG